jgi:exosortase A
VSLERIVLTPGREPDGSGATMRSETGDSTQGAKVWRIAIVSYALAAAAILFAFRETAAGYVNIWMHSGAFDHCALILPIVGYLIWLKRRELAAQPIRPAILAGTLIALVAATAWFVGFVSNVLLIEQAAIVLMLQALFLAVFGWQVLRTVLFPIFYLVFAIPFGDFLTPALQDLTAHSAVFLVRLVGVPVYVDGLYIHIPTGSFVVAEACAGLRFLTSSIALGVLITYLFFHSWRRRILFLALTVIVPILANSVRVFGIIMLAYLSNHRIAVGADHIVYGWVLFSLITIALIGIAYAMREQPAPSTDSMVDAPPLVSRGTDVGVGTRVVAAALLCVVMAGASVAYAAHSSAAVLRRAAVIGDVIPGADWQPILLEDDGWRPAFHGAEREVIQRYASGEQAVALFVAYYPHQRQGAEAISNVNRFDDAELWRQFQAPEQQVVVDGRAVSVDALTLRSGNKHKFVVRFYVVDGHVAASPIMGKMLELRARVLGRPNSTAAVAVIADCTDDPGVARAAIANFLKHAEGFSNLIRVVPAADTPRG